MSYYPNERRGGCMESITRCCRQAYVYPLDTRQLLYACGAVVGILLVAVVWSGLSSSSDSPDAQSFKGSSVLQNTPLSVGCNFFPENLRDLVQNNITKVSFSRNLINDSVFGSAACKSCQTDLSRLQSGLVGSQIWSLRVPCSAIYKDAVALTLEQVDAMSRLISSYPDNITLIRSSTEVSQGFSAGQLGGLLGVTSGHSIDGRMAVLRTLYGLGVRVMSLASDCSTAWAGYYNDANNKGLSEFGEALVKEMNRLGVLIDLSEASHQTQLDVLKVTKAPVIFSRGAAYGLVNNNRNIQDDVLQQLKKNGGMVMVTFVGKYINNDANNATINDVIKHLNYIKNITGNAGVGVGAEFDAKNETYPSSLNDVSTFPALFDALWNNNWSEEDLKKLAGQNFLQVLQQVEKVAKESASLPADEMYLLQENSTCYSDYDTRKNPVPAVTTNSPTTTVSTTVTLPSTTTPQAAAATTTTPSSTTTLAPTPSTTISPPATTTTAKPTGSKRK